MRWYVDISSIASKGPTSRYCVEAEQWQKALQTVRTQRGDDASFGNFSIELLDDGYRAIDPLTRTRYVVQRAPDNAPLTTGDAVTLAQEELTKVEGKPSSRPSAAKNEAPPPRASRPRGGRASDRGRMARADQARGRAPSIPDDPVPRNPSSPPPKLAADTTLASGTPLTAEASRTNGAASHAEKPASFPPPAPRAIPRTPDIPIVPPRPMQAETAFERMTGGSAVSLPAKIPASAEVQTEVLPAFKVLSRRSEDPTASSPLTYREMALAVATTTTLRDAEAIARAQFEVIRNAISGAPKGKFIQLAIFDHEFSGKPAKAPIVTLAFKDWRNPEPDLRFPQRDGPGPASIRSSSMPAPSASQPAPAEPAPARIATPVPAAPPPALASGAPSMAAPSTVEAPTMPILADTVVKTVVPTSMARPTIEPVTSPQPVLPDPLSAKPLPPPPAPPPPEPEPALQEPGPPEPPAAESEVIKPAPIIAIGASQPEDDIPISSEPLAEAAPQEAAPAAPAPVVPVVAAPASEIAPPTVPSEPPPAPTSSEIRARASEMADDQEKTLVKPSNPPPPPHENPAAEAARPASIPPPANEHVVNKTTKMAAVQHPSAPPPAHHPSAPPPAHHPSAPPAHFPSAPPPAAQQQAFVVPAAPKVPSTPPAGPPLLVRPPMGARRSGDDLITDLFEACSDLNFLSDPLDGADFVLALILDSIPSAIALCSFFDINTRELVVVRQGVTPAFASLPNALGTRASEFAPLIARTMRAGRSLVLGGGDLGSLGEDPRWRLLGVSPTSVIATGVVASGRYLGLIEVADPLDGAPFTESDGHALTYIGEQFSEYLSQREIDLSSERILRPKLAQARRN